MSSLTELATNEFHDLLQNASEGRLSEALLCFHQIQSFVKRSNIEAILYRCAKGENTVSRMGDIFFIGRPNNPKIKQYVSEIESVLQRLTDYFEICKPIILLEIDTANLNQAYSIGSVPGIGYIYLDVDRLSSSSGYSGFSRIGTIAHEVTHCLFHSGNRILDEGIAAYGEYIAQSMNTDLLKDELVGNHLTFDYQEILSRDFSNVYVLSDLSPDCPRQMYVKSALLIKYIVDNHGVDGIKRVFGNPMVCNFRMAAYVIESELGISMDRIQENIIPSSVHRPLEAVMTEEDREIVCNVIHWYNRQQFLKCEEALPRLEVLYRKNPNNNEIMEAIIMAAGSSFIHNPSRRSYEYPEAQDIQAKITSYVNKNRSSPASALFGILYEVIKLALANFEGATLPSKMAYRNSKHSIDRARKIFPEYIPIAIAEAEFVRNTPESFGGGRFAACKLLKNQVVDEDDPYYSDYLFVVDSLDKNDNLSNIDFSMK